MNRAEFMELHASCVTALGTYVVEAEKTTQMLAECTAEPLPFTDRFRLMSQGMIEDDAHVAYSGIKSLLYRAARLGYGLSN
jgi:hypothetical protein